MKARRAKLPDQQNGERDEDRAEQPAAPARPRNVRNDGSRGQGITQQKRERRDAEHPDQIAHEATMRPSLARCAGFR